MPEFELEYEKVLQYSLVVAGDNEHFELVSQGCRFACMIVGAS
jgi:6,7-dimethyl-8-ribityllumazine synthase